MAITLQQYKDALKDGSGTSIAKLEFLRLEDESIREDYTLIGEIMSVSVNVNKNNGVRRSISIKLANIDGEYNPSPRGRIWANSKFKLSLGLRIYNEATLIDEDKFFTQGTFVTRSPKVDSFNNGCELQLEGIDKFSLFDGQLSGRLQTTYVIGTASLVLDAFRAVLEAKLDVAETIDKDPILPYLQPITDVTLQNPPYTIIEGLGKTQKDLLEHMRITTSRDMFYDKEGRFKFQDDIADFEKAPKWNFSDEDGIYLGSSNTYEFEDMINKVVVVGSTIDGVTLNGVAVNDNVQSSSCIQRIGVKLLKRDVSSISTQAQADGYANYLLNRLTILQNSITIQCVPIHLLDVDEIITLTDNNHNYIDKRFVILGYSISDDSMSLTATDTNELVWL